jgi:DNA-binding XRE family transcriptional regulator
MPESVLREPIGKRIQRLREKKGWTLSELARKSDVSRSYIYQIEQGESTPTQDKIQKLADAFGIRPGELFGEQTTEMNMSESLREFAEQAGLESREIQMLAQIEYRGRRPSTVEEWRLLYSVIKGMLDKGNEARHVTK